MLVGDVRVAGLGSDVWHMWADMETRSPRVALCPLPGGEVFQFLAPLAPGEEPEPTLEAYQKVFEAGTGRTDVRLEELVWRSVHRVNFRMAERFAVGRVLLAGDAAHVHSPAGGQGLNTGVQDAYNLGWKLGAVLGGAPPALLGTYEEERLPVAAGVLGISTELYRKAVEGHADAFKRGEETEQLTLGYPDGSLSSGPRGGERAPDAVLRAADGSPTRLFEVFKGTHTTVLAFGTRPGDLATGPGTKVVAVVRPGEEARPGDLVDPDGAAHAAYADDGPALVVVRPDGYIASTGGHRETRLTLSGWDVGRS
ncbi:hypothetical protein GEV43_21235 [Actinomadura sp. J1-007]|nr:FAD-dependent monooxygenase [Actinomadura sp. J1-007]MWK36316.1 hypothetical protein [Actinomadura sp. J1-007]